MTVKKGIVWDFVGKFFNQGVSFIVSIFLARLLIPEDFALVGMAMAFLGVAQAFVDMGLSVALVQKQNIKEVHYSSIFWLNITIAFCIGMICFMAAPLVADFYELPQLLLLTQVLSMLFFFNALGGVPKAMLTRNMEFKNLSEVNIISSVLSGVLGVLLAYYGFGVWSLVWQRISFHMASQIMLWSKTRWLPKMIFDWASIEPLWHYSKKLFASGLLDAVYTRIDVFIIGKIFPTTTLAFYSRGKSLNNLISSNASGSLSTVLFPALSKIQSDLNQVKDKVITFFHLAAFISFFLAGFLYLTAGDIIILLFGSKWEPTIPLFKILVITSFTRSFSLVLLAPIKSLGRSDVYLKLEIYKKIILSFTYIIGLSFGIEGFLYALGISAMISLFINGYQVQKLLNWKLINQVILSCKYGSICVFVTIVFLFIDRFMFSNHILHLCTVFIGFSMVYFSLNAMFKTNGMIFVKNISVPLLKKILKK